MAAGRGHGDAGTATRILDVAERLAQMRGFNGFSYADIAAEVEITKAALHYHFATKADLGEALIARYAARFGEALAAIDAGTAAAPAKLRSYADLYVDVLRNQRMCLCGMLAAEYPTLPNAMQASVVSFFDQNEAWLRDVARMIISCLEGAMLVARPYDDIPRFQEAAASLMTGLASPSAIRR